MTAHSEGAIREGAHAGILVTEVTKSFGSTRVLDGISLEVEPGELVCFLGPSGCGKTTLLRCIAGLERPDSGRIEIAGRGVVDIESGAFVPAHKRGLGMVFQQYALWPHLDVAANIAYPLKRMGIGRDERSRRVRAIADFVGLQFPLDRTPAQLSGGQQQRVALARALVREPPALLLDEPLSNLDANLRARLRRELRALHERLGTTTILVTHDQDEATTMADRIAFLHEGRVLEFGTPDELFSRPATPELAAFIGVENFLTGRIVRRDGGGARIALPGGSEIVAARVPVGVDLVRVAIPAGAIRLAASRSTAVTLEASVLSTVRVRGSYEIELERGDLRLLMRRPVEILSEPPARGDIVRLDVDAERVLVFSAASPSPATLDNEGVTE